MTRIWSTSMPALGKQRVRRHQAAGVVNEVLVPPWIGGSPAGLGPPKPGIGAFLRQKFIVSSTLDDPSLVHDYDVIHVGHGCEPMRDEDDRSSFPHTTDGFS